VLLAGIKFGIGFSIGLGVVIAAILLIGFVAGRIQRHQIGHEVNPLKPSGRSFEEILWRNSSEAAMKVRGVSHRVLFRTIITWSDADKEDRYRKEPNYWH
jgi:hypothetical protein